MKKARLVRHTIDALPPLTARQRVALKALAARPDREIDVSDIRELPAKRWKSALRGYFSKPVER